MNVNLSLGIVSFILWSTFSTWYYVNFIRVFPDKVLVENNLIDTPLNENMVRADSSEASTLNEMQKERKDKSAGITLTRNIYFQKNSTALTTPQYFTAFSDSLRSIDVDQIEVKIVGHACDLGTEAYNLNLSKERAEKIAKQIKNEKLFSISDIDYKGESNPMVPNSSELNRVKNRRVNLQFIIK